MWYNYESVEFGEANDKRVEFRDFPRSKSVAILAALYALQPLLNRVL